jgi:hypothetical protein
MSANDEFENYWWKLLNQANVTLSGSSDAELKVQMFETLEEFFNGSNCWQETINFTVIPNTLDYPLNPLTGRILRLYEVLDQNNVPQAAVMPDIGTVHFLYPYTNTQPMTAVVVKTVTDPILCFPPNIPDWLLPRHGLALLHGVLGNMMRQPGQSYSNPTLAQFHQQRFRDKIAAARVAMMKMNKVGAQAWAFPQQFRVSGQRGGVSTFNVNPSPTPLR